jgi:hypothetical protein
MAGTLLLPKAALIRPLLNSSRPLCANSSHSPGGLANGSNPPKADIQGPPHNTAAMGQEWSFTQAQALQLPGTSR